MNFILRLDRLSDLFLSPAARKAVEHSLVRISLTLFLLHAALYAVHEWVKRLPDAGCCSVTLHILYTPFSAILVAEVYLLVYHLLVVCPVDGQTARNRPLIEIRSVFGTRPCSRKRRGPNR